MEKKEIGKKRRREISNGSQRVNSRARDKLLEEIRQLRTRLQDLQKKRRGDMRIIKNLRAEKDDFQRATFALLRKEFKPEDWKDFRKEDYVLSLDGFD